MIQAKIIADSVGPSGVRLTTFVLTYPRFIHSEFMTHRMVSKNSASSRAIPCKKTRAMVLTDPAMPLVFTQNQAGMQASANLTPWREKVARFTWRALGVLACGFHWVLEKLGVHKQHANRVLEPWLHMTVIATATDWANLFALRCHPMAQPEFQALANVMYDAYEASTPKVLAAGEWHLPFITELEIEAEKIEPRGGIWAPLRMSVARCARISYLNHDGSFSSLAKDTELYGRLLSSKPIHASPAEHQAQATDSQAYSGNLRGWVQYRKTLEGENITEFKRS